MSAVCEGYNIVFGESLMNQLQGVISIVGTYCIAWSQLQCNDVYENEWDLLLLMSE